MTVYSDDFNPDYAIHPGEYLEEVLESRNITNRDFADRVGLTEKAVSQIVNGKALYSPETAIAFEKALDIKAEIWLNLADTYQLFVARTEERRRLESEETAEWVNKFPLPDMRKLQIIPNIRKTDILADHILRFFKVSNPDTWDEYTEKKAASFRRSTKFKESPEATAVWLRIAERASEEIETTPFDKASFRETLKAIQILTTDTQRDFISEMTNLCASSGVTFVIVPELKATHLSGAARWLSPEKAMIALSLRYKKNDQFWFSFFHEAAHILLHGKKTTFLDAKGNDIDETEQEADRFAANHLMPQGLYQTFIERKGYSEWEVRDAARSFGIHPGIVVGRLQHEKHIPFSWHNGLKETIERGNKK